MATCVPGAGAACGEERPQWEQGGGCGPGPFHPTLRVPWVGLSRGRAPGAPRAPRPQDAWAPRPTSAWPLLAKLQPRHPPAPGGPFPPEGPQAVTEGHLPPKARQGLSVADVWVTGS